MVPQWCVRKKQARDVMGRVPLAIKLTYLAEVMISVEFQKIMSLILLNNLVFCLPLKMISFLAILD